MWYLSDLDLTNISRGSCPTARAGLDLKKIDNFKHNTNELTIQKQTDLYFNDVLSLLHLNPNFTWYTSPGGFPQLHCRASDLKQKINSNIFSNKSTFDQNLQLTLVTVPEKIPKSQFQFCSCHKQKCIRKESTWNCCISV